MSERILIVSDTHGRLNYFKEMLARTGKPDRLIHLGDSEGQQDEIARLAGCPVDIVRGNCDYSSDLAQDKLIEIGKYRVFLTHGHRYQVNFGIQTLKEAALLRGADIAMYGLSRADYQSGKGCYYLKSRKFNFAASGWFCPHIYIDGN